MTRMYRGREDFIYRMTIGELPFVTGIFPLGGRLGEKTTVALTGWNLPEKSFVARQLRAGHHFAGRKIFQRRAIRRGRLPEISAREPNHSSKPRKP